MTLDLSFRSARVAPEKADFRPALPLRSSPGLNGTTAMTKMTYGEQLKHPFWQRKRLEVLDAAGWACENCGDKSTTLHVHHKCYIKRRMAWEYAGDELAVLCEPCHQDEHAVADELKALLALMNTASVLALLRGYCSDDPSIDGWVGDIGRDRDPNTWMVGIVAAWLGYLKPDQLRQVAEFAVSFTEVDSWARKQFASHECEFGELP